MRKAIVMISLLAAACATGKHASGNSPSATATTNSNPGLPPFVLQALQSEHAQRAKFYIQSDGLIRKYTVYVSAAGVPDWLHKMADEKIGAGEFKSCEVEQYENGDQVYEVTRMIDGQKVELSIRTDKTLKYIERPVQMDQVPENIKALAGQVPGFTLEQVTMKTGPNLKQYQLRGKKADKPARLVAGEDGKLLVKSVKLEGSTIEVDW